MISTKALIQTAIFVALMVVGAWMPPVMVILGIPFTLQVLFSLMAGIVIGKNRGALSQIIYLLIGLIGLPVFAQFKGGLGAVVSPTFGFLLGFILGAFLSGLLYQKLKIANDFLRALVSTLCGTVAIYIAGIGYFYFYQNQIISKGMGIGAAIAVMAPFILPDIIKAAVAGFLGVAIRNQLIKRQLVEKE